MPPVSDQFYRHGLLVLILGLLLARVVNADAAAAPLLFDEHFEPQDWAEAAGDGWQAETGQWTPERARGETYLFNAAGTGSELVRVLDAPADEALTAAVTYGWRFGNGAASAEIELRGDGAKGLLLKVLQKPGPGKYELFAIEGEQRTSLGTLGDNTDDRGVALGGRVSAGTVALRYDPAGSATIYRLGGGSETVEAPADLKPHELVLRDSSAGNEQLRLVRTRAFSGDADPVLTDVRLRTRFGGVFEEGSAPELSLWAAWVGSDERELHFQGIIEPAAGGGPGVGLDIQGRIRPGGTMELQMGDMNDAPPGLYEVRGKVTATDGAAELQEVTGRFAILNAELANRPKGGIPQWVGIVPYLNVLPRDQFEPAFAFLDQIGVRHVRWLPGWGRIEPEQGEYDWSESDLFTSLCERYGIEAMFCLSYYGADWSNRAAGGQMARTPEGRELWVEHFAVPTIQRYGDRVKQWQIWNEPDAFWNEDPAKARGFATGFGTPANYYDLLVRTHTAAHALGIDGLRILPSLSSADQQDGLELLFEYGLADHFDGLIIHTYGNHLKHFQEARELLTKYGFPDAPIGSGEIGIPTGPDRTAELRQATKVARVLLSSTCIEPPLLGVDWFVLHNLVAGGQFGLLDQDLQPQPGVLAYFTVAHLLSGAGEGEMSRKGGIEIYRVERDGRPPLVALMGTGSTSKLGLKVEGNATPVAWNLWGQRQDLEMQDGVAEVQLDGDDVLIEGDVTPQLEVVASILPTFGEGGRPGLRVRFESDLEQEQQARVRVRSEALELDTTETVTLSADTDEVTVDVLAAEPGRQYEVTVEAHWPEGLASTQQQVEFTPITRVTAKQAASLQRPEGIHVIHLDRPEQATPFGQGEWGGPEDNSAQLAFGWTPEHLVLWITQRDDTHVPINTTNPWGFDGPQLALDASGERRSDSPRVEINFGIGEQGPVAFVSQQPHYQPELEAQREGQMTHYRLLVPLSQLQIDPEPGRSIGTALIINDNDGTGRKGWLSFGGGIAEEKNPASYRQLVFTGPSGPEPESN